MIQFVLHLITSERLARSQSFPRNIDTSCDKSSSHWWQCCRPIIPRLGWQREGRGKGGKKGGKEERTEGKQLGELRKMKLFTI